MDERQKRRRVGDDDAIINAGSSEESLNESESENGS